MELDNANTKSQSDTSKIQFTGKNPFTPEFTMPSTPKYHWIEDRDLKLIMKINSPTSVLISLACFGYVAGELRSILELVCKTINDTPFSRVDVIFLLILGIVSGVAVCTGIYGFFCKNEAKEVLEEIRKRKCIPSE